MTKVAVETASVIIPVYRRADWLTKCLDALLVQVTAQPFQTVVVDDGSPNADEIRAVVDSARGRGLEITFCRKPNGGPAAARNHGIRLATGSIVCFLDDDSVPDPSWLAEMMAFFDKNPEVGLVNGRTCSFDRTNPLPLLLEREVYPEKNWATCNIAYRRPILEALGGFDENFPEPSWEDNDLGLRSRWAGYLHEYHSGAVVYHPHEASIPEYISKCRLNGRGAAVFCRKYLFKKPWWGGGVPLVMSRRLIFGLHPAIWCRREGAVYLKFLWSWHSLLGFLTVMVQKKNAKN